MAVLKECLFFPHFHVRSTHVYVIVVHEFASVVTYFPHFSITEYSIKYVFCHNWRAQHMNQLIAYNRFLLPSLN